MATQRREPPASFVRRLRAAFPDFVDLRYNEAVARWEFVFLSAAGREVSQFYGWTRNPLTGEPIKPDSYTNLHPFRDLDPTAQDEIFAACQQTFIGKEKDATGDGLHDYAKRISRLTNENYALFAARKREAAQNIADTVAEMDIRRPGWLKDHSPEGKRLAAFQRQRQEATR
jgi:hypothetical protein